VLHVEKIAAFAGFDLARWRPRMRIAEPADRLRDCVELDRIREPGARLRKQILKAGCSQVYVDAVNMVFRAQRP
jgi:hypothetical protein